VEKAMGKLSRFGLLSYLKRGVVLGLCMWAVGCQVGPTVTSRQLANYHAMLDFSGLKPQETVGAVKVSLSPPRDWTVLPLQKGPLFTHQQWKSPSGVCGVGAVYIRMPLPFSANTLVWLAKKEYTKRSNEGRVIDEWVDELGRPWFEAGNADYHVRGYAMTDGLDAWIVYSGYKTQKPLVPEEFALAIRSAETISPLKSSTTAQAKAD
jgi:hypothetical protein